MRALNASRPGSDARYGIVTAFCAVIQSPTSLLSSDSIQRYGSATFVAPYVSTVASVREAGYLRRAGVCADSEVTNNEYARTEREGMRSMGGLRGGFGGREYRPEERASTFAGRNAAGLR